MLPDHEEIKYTTSKTSGQPGQVSNDVEPIGGFQQNRGAISKICDDDNVEHDHGEAFGGFAVIIGIDLGNATGEVEDGRNRAYYVPSLNKKYKTCRKELTAS